MARNRASRPSRYSRSARLGELLREILASELALLDDDRLELASITGVETSAELSQATVYISVLDDEAASAALEALEEHRLQLKQAVAHSSAVRRVPELVFALDPSISAGERVDQILRDLAAEDE
ncbi:MAG: 30S ribosome-binding factor RbfA [Acidimicrobiia bacterium]|nr:30S ribosome-binding factor RbfA [Acidimicrobiia bacterium]MCY4435276.1 30S ribosome-binding factor RbfA [bacterium]